MATRLRVNAGDLLAAMEDSSSGVTWYLDRMTGAVVPEGGRGLGGAAGTGGALPHDPDRYAAIEPIRTSRAWRIMADFVDGLPDSEATRTLARVLRERKPFARFQQALEGFPQIRCEWLHFKALTYHQMAEDWLELEEIDAELEEP